MKNINKIKSTLSYLTGTLFAISCIAVFSSCIIAFSKLFETGFNLISLFNSVLLIAAYTCYPYVLLHLRRIIDSSKEDLFIRENSERLKKIGNTVIIFAVINIVYSFVAPSASEILSNLVTIVASLLPISVIALICYVLSDALDKAIDFKEENELTI